MLLLTVIAGVGYFQISSVYFFSEQASSALTYEKQDAPKRGHLWSEETPLHHSRVHMSAAKSEQFSGPTSEDSLGPERFQSDFGPDLSVDNEPYQNGSDKRVTIGPDLWVADEPYQDHSANDAPVNFGEDINADDMDYYIDQHQGVVNVGEDIDIENMSPSISASDEFVDYGIDLYVEEG